jgi:hypothetical protein
MLTTYENAQAMSTKKINFRRSPYRGLLKEISEETGKSVPTVSTAIRRQSAWVLPLLREKIEERRLIEQEYARVLAA